MRLIIRKADKEGNPGDIIVERDFPDFDEVGLFIGSGGKPANEPDIHPPYFVTVKKA